MSGMTAQRALQMLENQSLWELVERLHSVLVRKNIGHAIIGGVAVCLHGYRRNTVDLDLLIRPDDTAGLRSVLEEEGFQWIAEEKEFRSPSGLAVQFMIAGEKEGTGQEATLPNPSDAKHVTSIEGLPVLSLAQLIQSKLACGMGDYAPDPQELC
jgi:hypothetical protein